MDNLTRFKQQIGEYLLEGCKLGEGSDLAICLPGFSLSGEWMARHYPALWTGKCCYFLDWPGLGDESLDSTPFDINIISEWVKMLVHDKKPDNIWLVCHSFGARVACRLLAETPFAGHLILIAPVTEMNLSESYLRIIPSKLYNVLVGYMLSKKRLGRILNLAKKTGILNVQEYSFLSEFSKNDKLNEYLIHYALVIPRLEVSTLMMNKLLGFLYECRIFLFQNDKLCNNKYWQNIAKEHTNIEMKSLKGSHFTRIIKV